MSKIFKHIIQKFQLPTGWNSTIPILNHHVRRSLFQLPTGWNSTCLYKIAIFHDRVSTPNGMEFYLGFAILLFIVLTMFQLPTGWNSTLPNTREVGAKTRFNSQRDGILLYCRQVFLDHSNSFNSQRDGILREFHNPTGAFVKFQFPTGWNSTRSF